MKVTNEPLRARTRLGLPDDADAFKEIRGLSAERQELDSMMNQVHRIDIDDPDVDMDMSHRMLYRSELFTGEVAEYQGGQMVCLDTYVDGIRNGSSQMWHPDGSLRLQGTVINGVASEEFLEWHPNGALKSRKFFDNEIYSLREETTWDEKGNAVRDWHRE
ncbi:toxin-antitoxin system YwqK family antitoxin [Streptomyces sp. NPDC058316]|uniref:toxin-antitoxin system YwqK family antitoxin n=1 Tax=unclassified Streptomyces TaxID=2593676 RepID=UPI0033330EEF